MSWSRSSTGRTPPVSARPPQVVVRTTNPVRRTASASHGGIQRPSPSAPSAPSVSFDDRFATRPATVDAFRASAGPPALPHCVAPTIDLSQSYATVADMDSLVARASASVADVCEVQVGQVKRALGSACESELQHLKVLLGDACAQETTNLRNSLTKACDVELQRVSSALASACAQEVHNVRERCQLEVERVKQALRKACEAEVQAVKELCQSEVDQVKASLRQACEKEVRLVRETCKYEVQQVRESLADAVREEVHGMVKEVVLATQQEVEEMLAEQRSQLHDAAQPYMRAVQRAQDDTLGQVASLQQALSELSSRLVTVENDQSRNMSVVRQLQQRARARERSHRYLAQMQHGCTFTVVRHQSAEGTLEGAFDALLGKRSPRHQLLHRTVQLDHDGRSLTFSGPAGEKSSLRTSSLRDVRLGAPSWCIETVVKRLSGAPSDASELWRSHPGPRPAKLEPWRFVTITCNDAPPLFLLAPSEDCALQWASGLSEVTSEEPGSMLGSCLWRRVRLRLDLIARHAARGANTRLGALAWILRAMVAEEDARDAWVRFHLSQAWTSRSFLEAAARGRSEAFVFDIHSLEDLDRAAKALGCRELHERCAQRLGDFESRIRMHRWADVVKHNNSGGCWIVMDGMLLDVEAWLPEHPGGTTIIPAQARNVDCTVFFELYHASRESFQYLKEFYIGEIWPEDRPLIPLEKERASDDFMQQLREYSATFRLSAEAQHQLTMVTHKSF